MRVSNNGPQLGLRRRGGSDGQNCWFILGLLLGMVVMLLQFAFMGWIWPKPMPIDGETDIVIWKDGHYRMVPVERKVEYVAPESKE